MTLRLAVFQGPARPGDVAENLAAIGRAASAAAAGGARVLVTPEMSATGYNIGDLARERAEPADGPIAARISEIASENGLAVVYGFPERVGDAVHNSVQVIDRDGQVLGAHRKSHLFGDLDRGLFLPGGPDLAQLALDGVVVGLLTCYDVEFPESVRAHALAGTELLVVPTGLMRPFEIVSRVLVPARAYESQVFVAYVNRAGTEGGWEYCGESCVVAPDGTELLRLGPAEQLGFADVDRDVLLASRAVNTHLQDRRPELYGALTREVSR